MISPKTALLLGSMFSFLSVAFGAFGAHALKDFLVQTQRLPVYEKAVQYQFYHALALILVGIMGVQFPQLKTGTIAICMVLGILIFSGSLYALCLTQIRWMGAITPLGGISFLIGWFLLAWNVWKL